MKKNKSIRKISLIFGLASFVCFNLLSCNQAKNEFIEVGLNSNYNSAVESIWNSFHTGLKAKTQEEKTQDIEVYYGNGHSLLNIAMNSNYVIDFNQILELKLTRYVYPSDYAWLNYDRFEKSEEILFTRNTLEYFLSEDFYYKNNSIIDIIEAKDLVSDYDEYGVISYEYVISPLENEPLKLYKHSYENPDNLEKIFIGDKITSRHNCFIKYTIDERNQIKFKERKDEKKENVNV